MRTCPACHREVPDGRFCVRCGNPLGGGSRGFAASPDQRVVAPSLIPTLFPHLPRADLGTFRIALGMGLGVVVLLAVTRFYPVAVGVSAAIVPVLTWLYLDDVDIYEEEPILVAGVMAASGGAGGAIAGFLAQWVAPGGEALGTIATSEALWRGVAVPVIAVVIGSIGPLAYLRFRRYNDVLDGVTFGAVAGATMSGTLVLSSSTDLLSSGLRPVGAVGPWIADLVALSLLLPVVFASAMAGMLAAVWTRFRAPVVHGRKLGLLGNPFAAALGAIALVAAASLARVYLNVYVALVVVALVALVGIVWLRIAIHVGLTQEAAEIHLGAEITCPNCGQRTMQHSFCANCGVSLLALPKATHSHEIPIIPKRDAT